jgi:hypothetical protein
MYVISCLFLFHSTFAQSDNMHFPSSIPQLNILFTSRQTENHLTDTLPQ